MLWLTAHAATLPRNGSLCSSSSRSLVGRWRAACRTIGNCAGSTACSIANPKARHLGGGTAGIQQHPRRSSRAIGRRDGAWRNGALVLGSGDARARALRPPVRRRLMSHLDGIPRAHKRSMRQHRPDSRLGLCSAAPVCEQRACGQAGKPAAARHGVGKCGSMGRRTEARKQGN